MIIQQLSAITIRMLQLIIYFKSAQVATEEYDNIYLKIQAISLVIKDNKNIQNNTTEDLYY